MTRVFTKQVSVAAVLLSLVITLWLVRGDQPFTEPGRNSSNISREDYRAALAKWDNLHVTDYEATIRQSYWGRWKIRVNVDNAYGSRFVPEVRASYAHRVVHFERLDNKAAEADPYHFAIVTVGALFDWVNDDLYCQENSCKSRDFFTPSHYVIEFDQAMGYPRSYTSMNEYATVETRIENVTILK